MKPKSLHQTEFEVFHAANFASTGQGAPDFNVRIA